MGRWNYRNINKFEMEIKHYLVSVDSTYKDVVFPGKASLINNAIPQCTPIVNSGSAQFVDVEKLTDGNDLIVRVYGHPLNDYTAGGENLSCFLTENIS